MNDDPLGCVLMSDNINAVKPQTTDVWDRDQSVKADGGKIRMELIPTSTLKALGNVLTYGAIKYSANSWKTVDTERYVGALLRHLIAFIDDPNGVDEESGLRHTEHLLANAAFINDAVMRGDYETKV